jgi:16S rRNA (cytosine1402-N4)-methyltransferase
MVEEVVEIFRPIERGVIIDATFGGGGHIRRLLDELDPSVSFLTFDRDSAAKARADSLGPRVRFIQTDFRYLSRVAEEAGIDEVTGVLFDLGLSSLQLDDPARGFGFRQRGPLDMRMDASAGDDLTADTIVNEWPEGELAGIISRFGEERFARRVAAAIVASRPIDDTQQLAEVVKQAIPAATRRRGGHPARRTFQALRIAVNDELAALDEALDQAIAILQPGGRLVVISYHSLEDRMVKRRLVSAASPENASSPVSLPQPAAAPLLRLLNRKVMRPSEREVAANPRARSAKLRAAERVA